MAITEMIVPGLRPKSTSAGESARWSVWGTTAQVTVTDPAALPAARRLVGRQFAAAEKAVARYRRDAELHKLYRAGGRPITVSPLLAELISAVPGCGSRPTSGRPVPGWQQVDLQGRRLQVPAGTTLDLSATAKAVACDQAAARVRDRLGVSVMVGLGGEAASAGPSPEGGWRVLIEDRAGSRQTKVILPAGAALATSHFTARTTADSSGRPELGAAAPGHLIDPHTGRPPTPIWRMASAIGFSSLEAATYTAAALVRGVSSRAWLNQLWVPARLITIQDDVITVGPWDAHLSPLPPLCPARDWPTREGRLSDDDDR